MEKVEKEELVQKLRNRSSRLIKLVELDAPVVIIKNEIKMFNDMCDIYIKKITK